MSFNIGDTVQLKSGGPVMTISFIAQDGECTCVWFHSSDAQKESMSYYPQAILTLFE